MSRFKPINRPELEANYWINEAGDIIDKNNTLITQYDMVYPTVHLGYWSKGKWKRKPYTVHRLVALTWQPILNPENHEIHHKDEDKHNPHNDNLQWVTSEQHRLLHREKEELNIQLLKLCIDKYGDKYVQKVLLKMLER